MVKPPSWLLVLLFTVPAVHLGSSGRVDCVGPDGLEAENDDIKREFERLLVAEGFPMAPRQVHDSLAHLQTALANHPELAEMKKSVAQLISAGQNSGNECDKDQAKSLGASLQLYATDGYFDGPPSVMNYLINARNNLFELCKPTLVEQLEQAVARLEAPMKGPGPKELSHFKLMERLEESVIRLETSRKEAEELTRFKQFVGVVFNFPDLPETAGPEMAEAIISFMEMANQNNNAASSNKKQPLKATTSRAEFEQRFKDSLEGAKGVCPRLRQEFEFFDDFYPMFLMEYYIAKEFGQEPLAWLKAWSTCMSLQANKGATLDALYAHLVETRVDLTKTTTRSLAAPRKRSPFFLKCFRSGATKE